MQVLKLPFTLYTRSDRLQRFLLVLALAFLSGSILFASAHLFSSSSRAVLARDGGPAGTMAPGLTLVKYAYPSPVAAGERLTYTICVTNTWDSDLHAIITDTLSPHVQIDARRAGTALLPDGRLVWQPVTIPPGQAWVQQTVVTVSLQYTRETLKIGYAGPLTNLLQVATREGPAATLLQTTTAVLERATTLYLPLSMRNYPRRENVLLNPGFEGIGLPLDNDRSNPDNWTQETFDGETYSEIFTPEGWVTWWEEGEYRRPESRIIPLESPYNQPPVRIYQGYYAAMYFSFYGRHNAGYYQRVTGLEPGAPLAFHAYAHAWSCEDDDHGGYSCGNPENQGFRVGIDPYGGVDPWSPNVIWSARVSSPDVYRKIGPLYAQAGPEGNVTVFLRSDVQWWGYKHSDAYWDNAALIVPVP